MNAKLVQLIFMDLGDVATNTGAIKQSAIEYVTERRDWLVVERLRLFRLKRAIDAYACTIDSKLQECVEAGRELGAEIALPVWETFGGPRFRTKCGGCAQILIGRGQNKPYESRLTFR
jgi:hypothetical protein